jgi:hypothetical protein
MQDAAATLDRATLVAQAAPRPAAVAEAAIAALGRSADVSIAAAEALAVAVADAVAARAASPGDASAHATPAQPTVAGKLLAELVQPDGGESTPVARALQRLGIVELEVGRLLAEVEGLAEGIVVRGDPAVPAPVSRRTADLLDSVSTTIARMQAVATALALACDGDPPRAGYAA